MRHYGLEGLQIMLRLHVELATWLEAELKKKPTFEMVVPRSMNLICFRYMPEGVEDQGQLNTINEKLLQSLNATGELYLTHTKIDGKYTLRMSIGQTNVAKSHVEKAWETIQKVADEITRNGKIE